MNLPNDLRQTEASFSQAWVSWATPTVHSALVLASSFTEQSRVLVEVPVIQEHSPTVHSIQKAKYYKLKFVQTFSYGLYLRHSSSGIFGHSFVSSSH